MKTKEEIEKYYNLIYGHGYDLNTDWDKGNRAALEWVLDISKEVSGTND